MQQDEVSRVRVGDSPVGIIGLKAVMEDMVGEYGDKSDPEVAEELLNRLGKRNYIPEKAKERYGKAFLREFKKFLGRPYEEEEDDGIAIRVLGGGCAGCAMLEREVIEAMAEMNLGARLEHVTDPLEIAGYGVMGTPALVVNGEVKCVGRVPPRSRLKEWLKEAQKK